MATQTVAKFQRELNSYQGLATLNIVFGGLAMAFGISFVVQSMLAMVQAQSILMPQVVLAVLGFVASGVSIRWLISSAELLDGVSDLKYSYNENKANLDDENIVSLLVKMTSHYRQNRPRIKTMMTISRIAGICFLIGGAFALVLATANLAAGVSMWEVFLQVLGSAFNFIMATASFAIPHFFGKYSQVWDFRLKEAAKAEKQLQKQFKEVKE
jgi:hypothetical protein